MMTNDNPTIQNEINLNIAIAQQANGNRFEEDEKRGIRDPRTGRFVSHKDYGGDQHLSIKFSTEAVFSKKETYLAGGVPKYVDMDFITIVIPGDNTTVYHGQVTDFHQFRFPQEYEAFKRGQDAALTGTPLELWPVLHPSQIQEMKNANIRTVEQIAGLSDSVSGVLRNFYSLKQRAKQFLEESKDKAITGSLRKQLDETEERHKLEMEALKADMEAKFAAMLEAAMSKSKKPTKADEEKQS